MRRDHDHYGRSCLDHYPPQAYRMDELPPITWQDIAEFAVGAFVLSVAFVVIFVYGAIWAVTP